MARDLPAGTVTFLFTDVQGSTALLHELGEESYAVALATHRGVVRAACAEQGGVEVDTQGDAFLFAFPTAPGATAAAADLTESLAADGPIRVRVGLHTGTPLLTEEGYVGEDLHRAARIAAAGHGGQVLVSSSTASLVDDELRDLGEHRFKDLTAPERVYQLGSGDFPALKSLYRTNLPVPATAFLGRDRELEAVTEMLERADARVVTLVGPGGTGKTRLALQAAATVSEAFPGGVFWVPLASLRDPELALAAVAEALGVKEQPQATTLQSLVSAVAATRLLLVLDNAEHLLPAVASDIAALSADAPSLTLVVTSRERLRITGEHVYEVSTLAPEDGVALFLARASAVDASLQADDTIAELCARLDNLPLAIELAAARAGLLTPAELLARLGARLDLLQGARDADQRQQTLRATIGWSYDLLSAEERRTLDRLSAFASCTIDAAEDVCGANLDTLQSLLDKSLLRRRETALGRRLWMLETIREFAAEQLAASSHAEETRDRHLLYFLALAQAVLARGEDGDYESERIEDERDNFRIALAHALASAPERALDLAGALGRYWNRAGHFREGREQLRAALAAAPEAQASARCLALNVASNVAAEQGDFEEAEALAVEGLALARRDQDGRQVGRALTVLGTVASYRGDLAAATSLLEESVREATAASDPFGRWVALVGLAETTAASGDLGRAIAVGREVVAVARERRSDGVLAGALAGLGSHLVETGEIDEARQALEEALEVASSRGLLSLRARALVSLGRLESAAQPTLAATHFQEALTLASESGATREALSALEGLGGVAIGRGDPTAATKLIASAAARREELGATRPHGEQAEFDEAIRNATAALGKEAFAAAWEQGRALDLGQAVELALDAEPSR